MECTDVLTRLETTSFRHFNNIQNDVPTKPAPQS